MKITTILILSIALFIGCMPKVPEQAAQKTPPMMGGQGQKLPRENPHGQTETQTTQKIPGGLDIDGMFANLPQGWQRQAPSSQMRSAQASLDASASDTENAELAIFYFPGTGGSATANIERWQGQYKGPNGESGKEIAKTSNETINGMKVITTDITGTQLASAMMTSDGAGVDKPNFRMIASVIETPSGNWFVKITGPKTTMAAREGEIKKFLQGIKLNPGENS